MWFFVVSKDKRCNRKQGYSSHKTSEYHDYFMKCWRSMKRYIEVGRELQLWKTIWISLCVVEINGLTVITLWSLLVQRLSQIGIYVIHMSTMSAYSTLLFVELSKVLFSFRIMRYNPNVQYWLVPPWCVTACELIKVLLVSCHQYRHAYYRQY